MNLTLPRRVRLSMLALAVMLTSQLLLTPGVAEANPATPDQVEAFRALWRRTEDLVYDGIVSRSWVWGPQPLDYEYKDRYRFGSTDRYGERAFRHYDKGRMEIDPRQPVGSKWYIRPSTLVKEMVLGRVQVSENSEYNYLNPQRVRVGAQIPVVGDPIPNNSTPTYATFADYSTMGGFRAAERRGEEVVKIIDREANTGDRHNSGDPKAVITAYDQETGHNIPRAFTDYFEQQGTVLDATGNRVRERLFDPLYIFGRPITEPYWARVTVDGKATLVLLQLFERRVLTYTPSNSPEWRVEMGNAGQHYLRWRHLHDLTFTGPARISLQKFTEVLAYYKSPVTAEAGDLYALIVGYGLDPAVALAFFVQESGAGTAVGYCSGQNSLNNKNWGNVRGDENGACGFMKFPTWRAGLDWWCKAMIKYYVNKNLNHMEDAIPVYAPASDGNDVNEYLSTMYLLMLRWYGYRT